MILYNLHRLQDNDNLFFLTFSLSADMVFPDQRSIVVYISLYYSYFFLEHHKTAVVVSPNLLEIVGVSVMT